MNKNSLKSLWWVIGIQFRTDKFAILWNIFSSIYDGIIPIVITFVSAKLIASVTDATFGVGTSGSVYRWLIIMLVLEAVSVTMTHVGYIVSMRFRQRMDIAASELYTTKLYQLNQEQLDDEDFQTMIERAQDSLYRLTQVTNSISEILTSTISFLTAIIAILIAAPFIGVIIILTVLPAAYMRVRQNKQIEETYKKMEPIERIAYRSRWYLLDPEQMPEVRLISGFDQLLRSWRTNMKKSQDMIYAKDRQFMKFNIANGILQPAIDFIANIYFFRLLLAGTFGLDRFIFLRGILAQASSSVMTVASSVESLNQLSIDMGNFEKFYQSEPAVPNGNIQIQKPLTIEFRNVSFHYPNTSELALDDVSFVIVPGSKLALVGENGAGKTTLIKLLLRQYLPSSGQILVNGTDIRDIEEDSYFAALSILSQNFLIISHLTIRENLVMGLKRDVKDEEIMSTADMVGARDFIQKFPHKLSQRLDSSFKDGSSLSGGQMQRLGVARAILRGGDIMILDEPTSAIDAKAEYNIFNNIYASHAGKTTLIVSHRFSTVRKADKVIVMEKGKVIEYGSHEELLKFGGLYKEMFEIQAEGYK